MLRTAFVLLLAGIASTATETKATADVNCTGVVDGLVLAYAPNSSLAEPMAKLIPADFNGSALLPSTAALQTFLADVLQTARTTSKLNITSLPSSLTTAALLSSAAIQDVLKLHLLYTFGMEPPSGAAEFKDVATMLKSSDKNFCPKGPTGNSMTFSVDEEYTFKFKSAVNSATGLDAVYSKKASCMNAGAFLIDAILLPCNFNSSEVVTLVTDAYKKSLGSSGIRANASPLAVTAAVFVALALAFV